jgi:hypothetical protein
VLAELQKFLASPMPPQTISFTLPTPADHAGVYHVVLRAENGPDVPVTLVTGNIAPPQKFEIDDKGNRYQAVTPAANGPIHAVRVRFSETTRGDAHAFFTPFSPLGYRYDFGWLGVYLLVYIVVLFPMRALLRIP